MNKPTDAEIDAVLCNHWPAFSMQATLVRMWLRDAMRASLDKWGQPAHSWEPVAWLNPWRADQVTTDYDAYGEHGIALYTAPQPVEREPLTEKQIRELWHDSRPNRFEAISFARAIERAHGIKGGQHGTE